MKSCLPSRREAALELLRRRGVSLPMPPRERLWSDPTFLGTRAGLNLDPWQRKVFLSREQRTLLLCSRQAGKSTVAACAAVLQALRRPGSLILLLSPTQRQSGELFRDKVLPAWRPWGDDFPAVRETAIDLELANGSRIIGLPGDEETVRGYSGVALLVIDEAARVPDSLYASVRPMLAISQGRLIALSTPFGKRGWFFEAWSGSASWQRVRITADQCPRISPAFLAEERQAIGDRWYRQEYECSFEEVLDSVFSYADIAAACADDAPLLFAE